MIALWIIDSTLGFLFLFTGARLALLSKNTLEKTGMHWVTDVPLIAVKGLGLAEVLGAVGLVLPLVIGTVSALVPLAAACLLILMIGATLVHTRRRENPILAVTVGVVLIASFTLAIALLPPT